ncbi:MAG: hypothetical protein ACYCWE_08955 [Eubacteriales bacterium]
MYQSVCQSDACGSLKRWSLNPIFHAGSNPAQVIITWPSGFGSEAIINDDKYPRVRIPVQPDAIQQMPCPERIPFIRSIDRSNSADAKDKLN